MSERKIFHVGVDIGMKIDHSVVCLVEEQSNRALVRLLVKYPLGTPYPLLVETVTKLTGSVSKQGDIWNFVVDATGIGEEPAKMFQEALPEVTVVPFIFTNISKKQLVGKIKVMHSFGRLKFAARKGDPIYNRTLTELITEMKNLQVRKIMETDGNPEIELFKTNRHDDIFTAVALSIKDIEFDIQSAGSALFVKDNSWLQNPLTEDTRPDPSAYFF